MEEEIIALEVNQTFDLMSLSSGKQSIGCKWIFTMKVNLDGIVARLKAQLMAKGYVQTYGMNYFETLSSCRTYICAVVYLSCCILWLASLLT